MGKKINKLKSKKYSDVKERLGIQIDKNIDERLAPLTHYLQNSENGVSEFFKPAAIEYYKEIKISNDNLVEDEFQYYLPIKWNIPFPPPEKHKFTFIDLFAGIGGFRLALQNLEGKCTFTSEWNDQAKRTYEANFGEVPFGDITKDVIKQSIPDGFQILCAGFPCQAFSIAGHRGGFNDTRGTLFFDLEKIIEAKRPKVVFLENVKNLQSHDSGNTFRIMIDILENKLKYKVYHKVLNTMTHANVPQNRERIFIVAFDPAQVKDFDRFEFPKPIKLTKTIHDFLEKGKQSENLYYPKKHQYYSELNKTMRSKDTIYQWRRIYVRENKSNVCPTLTANMGAGGHNVPLILDDFGIRKLTPKECFAFQGYPVSKYILPKISNSSLYMQAGNSVTTTLIQRIASNILEIILK